MYVKEIWRYPAKSMAGEQIEAAMLGKDGVPGDRQILVRNKAGRVITSRTHHGLLGLKGSLACNGKALINGYEWDSPEALELVRQATGLDVELFRHEGSDRFDILPLLVATDGAIAHMGFDSRRFRANILIGDVEGLAERDWPGKRLRIGEAVLAPRHLRGRCVMTTYDPDTLKQDPSVLRRIVNELDGTLGLDTSVER